MAKKTTLISDARPLLHSRLLFHLCYLFIFALFSILFTPPTLHAETLFLHPSGKSSSPASSSNWVFSPSGSEATAFDSNDGDTSYASSTTAGSTIILYMDLDDPSLSGWTINSVQVVAVARKTGSDTNIQVGHRVGSTNSLSSSLSVKSTSYRTYLGPLQSTNPSTSAPWTWDDISNLIAVVVHSGSSSNPLRVTELFVKVDYSKALSSSGKNALTSVWDGAGTISSSSTTVTGVGTNFNTKLIVGSLITANGQTRTVTAISSATGLSVNSAFSPNLSAGTAWTYVGWAFNPATGEATNLDTHDSDTSYAQSLTQDDKLYIDLDDFPASTATITGVQLHVVARCITLPCNLEVGIRTNNTDFVKSFDAVTGAGTIYSSGATAIKGNATSFTTQLGVNSQITAMGQTRTVSSVTDNNDLAVSSAFSPQLPTDRDSAVPFTFVGGTTTYQRFTSNFFTRNPATLAPWSWSDINNLIGVVNHVTNANGLRVTQVYLSISTIVPSVLGYSPDAGYGSADGVHPDSGGITSPFTYKIVYTNLNNNPPTSIKVHIDGDGGRAMTRDVDAKDPDFRDLDYTNGEQYTYTASSLPQGPHTYYFSASDGSDSTQKPASDALAGPGIAIAAGTLDVLPSGENIGTFGDWGFNGGSASTALDTSDGNTSYSDHSPNEKGEFLYLDMDDPGLAGPSITAVQVSAVMCSPSSAATVRLGLRLSGADYVSNTFSVAVSSGCATYTTYTPSTALFTTNPDTGKAWNWQDINDMIGVVVNETKNAFRITQFKVSVTHSPIGLSFAQDPGYITDGVNPDSGSSATTFTYKVIYTNANGTAPAAGNPKVHIDGSVAGVAMSLDTSASDPTLYDGNYVDGEQYTYTAPSGYTTGTHTYYFDASDGAATVRFPVSGDYSGPAISLPAGSFNLFPTDVNDGTSGWTFCNSGDSKSCFDPKTSLDTSDGDSTYAKSRRTGEDLYMSLDNPNYNGQFITSVQVKGVARHESGAADFTLGVYSVADIAESPTLTTTGTSYATFSGTVYDANPMTGLPWTWVDLENLIAVVRHKDNDRMRVTQLFVVVNYGPVRLNNSSEPGYIIEGIEPNLGNTTTSFKFKTVYYQVNNVAPAAGYPKVHIDGDATGVAMSLDTQAPAALQDGNYANGEQYIYTTTLAQGSHTYYFTTSDGTNTARSPGGTATYNGPDVALNGAAPNLAPSGKSTSVTTTGWTFTGSDTTALDGNDGDTSYAKSTVNGDRLYMDFDDPATLPDALSIRSIQLFAVARDISTSTTTGFDFGLRLGGEDYLSGTTKTLPDAYGTAIAGTVYTINPATGENWTWDDIKGIRAVVVHQTNNNEVRVTQLYLTVTYSPIQLTYSTDPRYFDDGVDPNGGTTATTFNYRIVYTQAFGLAPAAGYPKVHIDGNATGVAMTLDAQAPAALQDGNYTNGEQYLYATTLAAQGTPHNYYFDVSDSTNTARTPLSGTLSGPVVSANAPTLSFPSQTGYALESAGTGTLTTSGTNTVTGTGTSFTTQLRVGTTITAASGQTRTITAIASDTSLTTDTPFSPNLSGASFTYAVWSGTGTLTTSGTTTVTGSGTSFTTQLQIGSTITASGQTRTVTAIASNTSLTVDTAFSPNLSGASFTFAIDLPLRGVEPNVGNVNTLFVYKIIYTDADNNPPVTGYPRLLLDYNTIVYAMSLDTGAAASLQDGNYTNGEQYTVTINISSPGTHAYSFDATDGVTPVFWPLDGDGFLAPSITDSVSSGVIIYPASRNSQTFGFTFQGSDQDPSTALDAGYAGDGTISNAAASTTVTGVGTNFTAMSVGSIITAGSPAQTRRVTAIANDTSLTVDTAFSPNLSGVSWLFDGDISYARAINSGHKLYMNMDDVSRGTSVITSVQFFAVIRDKDAHDQTFKVGLQVGGTDYTTTYATNNNSNYVTYAHPGSAYTTNPKTGQAWTWSDIDSLIGVVICTTHCHTSDELRVTQMYIKVNYDSLPTLSYSPEGGYNGTDGVDPDGWNPNHIFNYKVVYASGANFAPTSLKVFIDGDAGHEMIHDGAFITNDPLRNGDYTDGEQFYYSTNPNQLAVGPHNYYFLASDGTNTFRLPTSGTLSGPNVSVNEPFLTFSSESGYVTDGINPNNGESGSTQFTYKVVYTHPDNNRPLYVKVHIDGDEGRLLTVDSSAAAALRDGNYVNGEQYNYTTNLSIGGHTYLLEATDGAKQVFLPVVPSLGLLSGPTVTDLVAPNAVTNLAISARTPTSTTLTWTAPGDAGTGAGCPCGTVTSYNIRYSTLKIVDDAATPGVGEIRFSDATSASASLTPKAAGTTETFTVTGLTPNTPYYFAMKSTDAKPWTSAMSNVVNASADPPVPSTNLLSSWNMVSVPITPSPADVATVFGSSVGVPVNIRKWVSTGTTNQTGSYVTLSGTDTVQAGVGYFLESPDGTRFLNPAGSANAAATFSISLKQGYNIIGNPYTKDVALDATCVSRNGGSGTCTSSVNDADFKSYANAAAAGWVGNALYRWDGAAYTFRTYNDPDPTLKATLQLWQGYWLQVTDANAANTYSLIVVKP